jgi:trypsin
MDVPLVKLNADTTVPRVGESVRVMGWGDMTVSDFTEVISDVLMSADLHVMSNQDCNISYNGEISDNMMCATDKGQDSCHGDSGGPLVIQGIYGDGKASILVGAVSWGVGCGLPDFPGVYARISPSYSWIKNEVCNQSSNPPAYFLCGGISSSDERGPTTTSEDGKATEQFDRSDSSISDESNSIDVAEGSNIASSTTVSTTVP